MVRFVKKLISDERGQDLAEYAIALAVIAVGAGVAALAIATDVNTLWSTAQSIIHTAV